MIRICIPASNLVQKKASGTSQVAKSMIYTISKEFPNQVEFTLLVKSEREIEQISQQNWSFSCKFLILPKVRGRYLNFSRRFYKFCRVADVDFDVLHFNVPRVLPFFWKFPAKKFVCTFHAGGDITVRPDKLVMSRYLYNLIMKTQWKKFDEIIAVSDFAKREIQSAYKIPAARIRVIGNGVDSFWHVVPTPIYQEVDQRNLIVVMGRWQRYKNVHTIIDVFSGYPKYFSDCSVLIIGDNQRLGKDLVYEALKRSTFKNFIFENYLPISELKYLYINARLVIIPSLNEGFGLPSFEAFGDGAEIMVHDETPAAEILREFDGVFAVNMLDKKAITDTILEVISTSPISPSIKDSCTSVRRSWLEKRGFTWKSIGKAYLEMYSA